MVRCLLASLGVALSLTFCPLAAQVGLPYSTDYEAVDSFVAGAALSAAPWSAGDSGASITTADFASDAQSVLLPDGSNGFLSASFTGAQSGGIVFVDFYLKPVAGTFEDLPEQATDLSSALSGLVDEAGTGWLYVVHGDGQGGGAWQKVPTEIPLTTGVATNWVRFTYRLNYSTKTWDLYLDDELVATDLRFLDDVLTQFTEFRLKGGGLAPAYFDFFYAGYENPVFNDSDKDGMSDAYETANLLDSMSDDRYGDADFDGVSNIMEFMRDMEAGNPDTDGDGVHDGWELSFGADPLTADAYALSVVPFADSFEQHPATGLTSANGWSYLGSVEPEVSSEQAATGANSAKIASGEDDNVQLYNLFSSQTGSVVWVDLNVRPGAIDSEPELGAMTSAGFYFGSDGLLRAFDGAELPAGAWRVLNHTAVDTDSWQRLTIRLNYPVQRWSLYLDGKRIAQDYGFANPVPYFQSFSLVEKTGGTSYLDDVSVAYVEPSALDNDSDGLLNSEEDINQDGIVDAGETDPESTDSDVDGIGDWVEGLFGLSPTLAQTNTLPTVQPDGSLLWQSGFESSEGFALGAIDSQLGWLGSGTSTVVDTDAVEGTQSLSVTGADSTAYAFSGWDGVSEVWVSFRAKLIPGVLPDASSFQGPVSAVFGLSNTSRLAALDTTAGDWRLTDEEVEEGWQDYAIFLDYREKTWDLLLNGVIQFSGIGFTDPRLPHFVRFQVRNDSDAKADSESLIDVVAISDAEPAGLDFDGDGIDNATERSLGSDVLLLDSDGDLMPDGWEYQHGFDLTADDSAGDLDGDGLHNLAEYEFGFDPSVADIAGVAGFANRDIYNSISGNTVSNLTNDTKFPLQPDVRTLLTELSSEYSEDGDSNYGQRIRGTIIAPVTGDYTFWIASDNESEFWLSTNDTAYEKNLIASVSGSTNYKQWTRYSSQRSFPITLTAGQEYFFEILHKEGGAKDHVSVAWQYPGQSLQVVPGQHLRTIIPDPNDLDEDGLPDDWEIANGLDPAIGYGVNGFAGDADGDGLANYQERIYETNPLLADSDGDGYSDYIEVKERMTDPAEPDPAAWVTSSLISGTAATTISGEWINNQGVLRSTSINGQVSFPFTLSSAGIYQIHPMFFVDDLQAVSDLVRLHCFVAGEYIGFIERDPNGADLMEGWLLTPFLNAGNHSLEIIFENVRANRFLNLVSVEIQDLAFDVQATRDAWNESFVLSRSHPYVASTNSLTSPYCLEGQSPFAGALSVGAETSVTAGTNAHWYSDVDLNEDSVTNVLVSLENGGATQVVDVNWLATNLFDHETLTIRQGDALKLVAVPAQSTNGSFVIEIAGQSSAPLATGHYVHRFDQAGDFQVNGIYTAADGSVSNAQIQVKVVGLGTLAQAPSVMKDRRRSLVWPSVSDDVIFDAGELNASLVQISNGDAILELVGSDEPDTYKRQGILGRLGQDGPILGSTPVNRFWLRAVVEGYLPIIRLSDDSFLARNEVFVGNLPGSTEVRVKIFKAGVTFEDGTRTKSVYLSDFDDSGRYQFTMIVPPEVTGSACHNIEAYDEGTFIGRR